MFTGVPARDTAAASLDLKDGLEAVDLSIAVDAMATPE
jgi:hypothetical protein